MKTKRVRFPIAMDADGDWYAYGQSGASEEAMQSEVTDIVGGTVSWIEADIPIPEPQVIEGRVVG